MDYLSKASEVKDHVHKYPLTYHLAEYMIDHFSDGTDLYSEFGAVSRSSRVGGSNPIPIFMFLFVLGRFRNGSREFKKNGIRL